MGDQSVVIQAEKGKVKMLVDGEETGRQKELVYDYDYFVISNHDVSYMHCSDIDEKLKDSIIEFGEFDSLDDAIEEAHANRV